VAVTVADPVATEVTSPADETVAIDVSEDSHVTTESGRTFPSESFTVALSVAVSPSDKKESELGGTSPWGGTGTSTTTIIVGSPTVTEADPLAEPDVAMIEIDPVATEVTVPEDETVATAVFVDVHVTGALAIVAPFWSLTVAVSCFVSPIAEKLRVVDDSVTEVATGVVEGGGPVGVVPPSPHATSSSSTTVSRKYRILSSGFPLGGNTRPIRRPSWVSSKGVSGPPLPGRRPSIVLRPARPDRHQPDDRRFVPWGGFRWWCR
jgi:hypothetical protein